MTCLYRLFSFFFFFEKGFLFFKLSSEKISLQSTMIRVLLHTDVLNERFREFFVT